jgi:hypothetical protein
MYKNKQAEEGEKEGGDIGSDQIGQKGVTQGGSRVGYRAMVSSPVRARDPEHADGGRAEAACGGARSRVAAPWG